MDAGCSTLSIFPPAVEHRTPQNRELETTAAGSQRLGASLGFAPFLPAKLLAGER